MLLPPEDTHFRPYVDGYQRDTYAKALEFVTDFGCAIDVGAHVGFWSLEMAKNFTEVHAFEPQPENFACLSGNAPDIARYNIALGETPGWCRMETPARHNSGAWEAKEGGDIEVLPLDGFALEPGLIKIDVQGMELAVLKGAEETILRSYPVLVVECVMNGVYDPGPREFIEGLGMEAVARVRKDFIFAEIRGE